jgi:putative ABC transport system permease protein
MGFTNNINPENSISTVLVKIKDGYDLDTVTHNIRSSIDGVQVIKTKSITTDIAENLNGFTVFIYLIIGMLLLLTLITLSVVFSVTVNERKKEFGVLRAIGATRIKTSFIILKESLFISVLGGIAGVLLASIVVFPFSTYIGDLLSLPYLQPNIYTIIAIFGISLFVSFLAGPLSAAYSAIKISKAETYLNIREGG